MAEFIPLSLTKTEAQYFSALAQASGDNATLIMCDEIVSGDEEIGQVLIKNEEDFDNYMSMIRMTTKGYMGVEYAPVRILRRMQEMLA